MLIQRPEYLRTITTAFRGNPVCALLGPRQCGKTTLAMLLVHEKRNPHIFDLETAASRARLARPELTLSALKGLVIIDEIQRMPELFNLHSQVVRGLIGIFGFRQHPKRQ